MPRRIVLANQKGGVGKSTGTLQLSRALADQGQSVLVVDCDPQCNATQGLIGIHAAPEPNLWDILNDEVKPKDAIIEIAPKLHLIPGSQQLASADLAFAQRLGRETMLKKTLKNLRYDFLLFDSPPSLALMTVNAMMAATEVLIPVDADAWAVKGLQLLEESVEQIRKGLGHKQLHILGCFLSKRDHTNLARDTDRGLQEHFGDRYFKTRIPVTVRMKEANAHSVPISEFVPDSEVAIAYNKLAEEVIARG